MYAGKADFTIQCIKAIVGTGEKKKAKKQSVSVTDSISIIPGLGVPRHLKKTNPI